MALFKKKAKKEAADEVVTQKEYEDEYMSVRRKRGTMHKAKTYAQWKGMSSDERGKAKAFARID